MKYYTINEKAAKEAKSLWSFSDYEEESKTREYQSQVDEVYTIVSELPEELQEKGEALADAYAKKLADWYNKQFKIESMHPSVMISGAGHFNVQKKEKQNQAQSKHYAEYDNIQSILYKIKNLPKTAKIIKSGDADAVEKLKAKIEKLEADQTEMKEINAYYRKYKTMKGYANLTDEKAKERLASLEKVKATAEENNDEEKFSDLPFTVVRNAEIREVLKKNGFRFAPSQNNA